MTTTRLFLRSVVFAGTTEGTMSNVLPDDRVTFTTRLSSITIRHGPELHSIEVVWSNGDRKKCGNGGQTTTSFILMENERVTSVRVYISAMNETPFSALSLQTNNGRKCRFGSDGGICKTFFSWQDVSIDKAASMGLIGFVYSDTSDGIRGLSAVWAEYVPFQPPVSRITAKYEQILFQPGDSPQNTPGQTVDSAFTRLLMSPMVTLSVGPIGKTFYAHEATLCKLPFFRAALNGLFAEARLRAVTLPEDEPSAISALVEFLSTGVYTYAFHAAASSFIRPPANEEGVFHIGVYVVADKYDCPALAGDAKRNFREVIKEMSGPEVARAWIMAYEAGMRILESCDGGDVCEDGLDARVLRCSERTMNVRYP